MFFLFTRLFYFVLSFVDKKRMEEYRRIKREKKKERKLKEQEQKFVYYRQILSKIYKYINIGKYQRDVEYLDNLEKKIIQGCYPDLNKQKFEKGLKRLIPNLDELYQRRFGKQKGNRIERIVEKFTTFL